MLFAVFFLVLTACNSGSPSIRTQPLSPELTTTLDQVAELRALPRPPPFETALIPRDRVRDTIEDTFTDTDRESFERLTALYRLLGFIGQDEEYEALYLDFVSSAAIGFYEPVERRLYVVGEGDAVDWAALDPYLRTIVAHEFVHAIQAEEFGFPETTEKAAGDLDWSLALSAIVEGDAVFHERLWAREHLGASPFPPGGIAPGAVPAPLERLFRFPYEEGLNWVATVQPRRGNEAVNGIVRGRRLTTAEILHPQLYEAGFSPELVQLPDLSEALGEGWERQGGGSFGEFNLRNFLQLHLPGLAAVQAADGWSGDGYGLYVNGDESAAAVPVLFTDEQQAEEFEGAMDAWFAASGAEVQTESGTTTGKFAGGRTVVLRTFDGARALLVFGSSPELAAEAASLLGAG